MRIDVPFFPPDLLGADREVLFEVIRDIGRSPEQTFVLGERTRRFEQVLRDSLGAADVIACGSGTSALALVLRAMDVGTGDEVVVPAFGCAPLASSVLETGAIPVFADIDPRTLVVDPDAAARLINHRTKAIMPAHQFSVMADMPRFAELAADWGVRLVEDSAVAQGAVLGGTPAGLWGEAGVFSFLQAKSLGLPGEGGAVVTRDPELGRRVRKLRDHGQSEQRFVHHVVGPSSRFDEIQATFGLHRFTGLQERLRRRAEVAEHYTRRFAPLADRGVLAPPQGRDGRCYDFYCVLAEERDALREHLAAHGIGSHVHYPLPLPHQVAFTPHAPFDQQWPNAVRACGQMLALPLHPQLTDAEVGRIADAVCEFAGGAR